MELNISKKKCILSNSLASPGLQKADVLISAESYPHNEEIKDTISSSSVNSKSIQHKEHHCLKNVACWERMSLLQAFCVRYIKFVNVNRVCQSVQYNTFVTVLIAVELSNKESHFIRVIMELQGESKSPPNKRCQLVVLIVAGLLRVTLVNYNQIQNWLPCPFTVCFCLCQMVLKQSVTCHLPCLYHRQHWSS